MAELNSTSLISDANLQAYLRFENNLTDSGPNGYTFTNTGTTDTSSGKFGHGRSFVSASSQYITSSGANLNVTTSQSWIAWLNPTTINNNSCVVGIRNSAGGNVRGIFYDSIIANTVRFEIDGLSTNVQVNTATITNDGAYHLVIGVYNSSTGKLSIYYDNVRTDATVTGSPAAITGNFVIGRLGDQNQNYYNGLMDEFAFFNRALTDAEVNTLYTTVTTNGSFSFNFV